MNTHSFRMNGVYATLEVQQNFQYMNTWGGKKPMMITIMTIITTTTIIIS